MKKQLIVLMTDFGNDDIYVGVVKGVIKNICPDCDIIDLTHNIPSYDIEQAAIKLYFAEKYYPENTVFLCVVDPGVGSDRRPIGIRANNKYFIAPDNGLLSLIIDKYIFDYLYWFNNSDYYLKETSNTFHCRDIFAPIAAHIAKGVNLDLIGKKINLSEIVKFDLTKCKEIGESLGGSILYIDKFGNIVTSIDIDSLNDYMYKYGADKEQIYVLINNQKITGISNTFSDVKIGELLAYTGSFSMLEIGVRNGNASDRILGNTKYKDVKIELKVEQV